jgi:hypothetical protein
MHSGLPFYFFARARVAVGKFDQRINVIGCDRLFNLFVVGHWRISAFFDDIYIDDINAIGSDRNAMLAIEDRFRTKRGGSIG